MTRNNFVVCEFHHITSLANHSQTEQGWFYVNFDGHLASFCIHENPQKIKFISFIPSCLVFIYKLSRIMSMLERKVLQVLSGVRLVCYGAAQTISICTMI